MSCSPRAVGSMPAASSRADAAAEPPSSVASDCRSILRRWPNAASTSAKVAIALLPRCPGGSAARSKATRIESTFGTGQNTWRLTVPAMRPAPVPGGLDARRAVDLRSGRGGDPLADLRLHHHERGLERRHLVQQVQQHGHRHVVGQVRDEPDRVAGQRASTRSASSAITVSGAPGMQQLDRAAAAARRGACRSRRRSPARRPRAVRG